MGIHTIHMTILLDRLKATLSGRFGDFVMWIVGHGRWGDLHANEEAALLDNGSVQRDLRGISA